MTKPVLTKWDEDLLARIDADAKAESKESRTAWLHKAAELRLMSAHTSGESIHPSSEAEEVDRLTAEVAKLKRSLAKANTAARPQSSAAAAKAAKAAATPSQKFTRAANPIHREYPKKPSECSHNFRQKSGWCPTCGDQRK